VEDNVINQVQQPKIKNTWKAIAVISISVAVVLACLTVFFATRNSRTENNETSIANESIECPTNDLDTIENGTPIGDTNNYFVINEWGIRFAIPVGLGNLTYTIEDDSRPNVSVLSVTTAEFDCKIGFLYRSTNHDAITVNRGNPRYEFNGYHYWYGSIQSLCAEDDDMESFERTHRLIREMLTVPIR
jgi:hypothetical protein